MVLNRELPVHSEQQRRLQRIGIQGPTAVYHSCVEFVTNRTHKSEIANTTDAKFTQSNIHHDITNF